MLRPLLLQSGIQPLARNHRFRPKKWSHMLTELQQKVRQEQAEAFQKLADENQKASEEFLAANLSKNGIVALPSGIQYRIIDEGEGARPGMDSTVKVHYRGSKTNGLEFDSSFARGVPEEFTGQHRAERLAGSSAADEDRSNLADIRSAGNGFRRSRQSAGWPERSFDF